MQNLIETPDRSYADPFRTMASRVDHNEASSFGGAAVIIPPSGGGNLVEVLILDPKNSPAQFWATLKTRIDMELAALDEQQRGQRAFGR
jgi:hypothetical protein